MAEGLRRKAVGRHEEDEVGCSAVDVSAVDVDTVREDVLGADTAARSHHHRTAGCLKL